MPYASAEAEEVLRNSCLRPLAVQFHHRCHPDTMHDDGIVNLMLTKCEMIQERVF